MSVHKERMPSDVELHYKTISYTQNTNNKDICNTNNKLFMILYNCNFMMYCMRFHTGFLFGVGLRVYFATPIFWNLHYFDAHLCIRVYTSH